MQRLDEVECKIKWDDLLSLEILDEGENEDGSVCLLLRCPKCGEHVKMEIEPEYFESDEEEEIYKRRRMK